jgi:virginiamycin B lyase
MKKFATLLLLMLCSVSTRAQSGEAIPAQTQSAPSTQESVRGFFREYALDQVSSGPAIVTIDEDDNVWVALARTGKLARFANGAIDTFELGAESRPVGLAAGSRANGHAGAIWIAASYDNKLIRFDVVSKQVREYKIEGENSWPFNLALGSDGSVWFTERASSRIGRLNQDTGEVRHYDLPTPNCGPAGLAVDLHSGLVWFTESYADRIGALDPASGKINEFKMSDTSTGLINGPAGLTLDAQGGVWFAKLEGKLGHIRPGTGAIELTDVPTAAKRPAGLIVTANGDVWAVALDGNLLLRYTPATRHFTLYPIPTGEADERPGTPPTAKTSRPFGIASDHQGNIWFSQQYAGQLAVLDNAPPDLAVLSPAGIVRTADVLLTVRALDRASGVARLKVTLDGKPVTQSHGRLDLRETPPGPHKLEVSAIDMAGLSASRTVDFNYAPGPFALLEMLRQLEPANKLGADTKIALMAAAQELTKGDPRSKLIGLRQQLANGVKLFKPFSGSAFDAVIKFQLQNSGQSVEVRIVDDSPYFSQTEVVVRKGDTVHWKYDPPSDGHSISHLLHRIEIQGTEVRSGMLRSGESFAYRFERSGDFSVRDTEKAGSRVLVKVLP